jgi:hypothetical protein
LINHVQAKEFINPGGLPVFKKKNNWGNGGCLIGGLINPDLTLPLSSNFYQSDRFQPGTNLPFPCVVDSVSFPLQKYLSNDFHACRQAVPRIVFLLRDTGYIFAVVGSHPQQLPPSQLPSPLRFSWQSSVR